MNRLRIVLDTNIFLVSLAEHHSWHWIFQAIIWNRIELCVSTVILLEYEEIIQQRFGLEKSSATLDFLLFLSTVHRISRTFKWDLLHDKDDNKFIDCAVAGRAD